MFRRLYPNDLDQVMTVADAAYLPKWERSQYEYFLNHPHGFSWGYFCKDDQFNLVSFLLGISVRDSLDIISIATHQKFVRRGFATGLLTEAFRSGYFQGAFLEVDVENTPAIGLYESLGFRTVKRRLRYYQGNRDALLMKKDL